MNKYHILWHVVHIILSVQTVYHRLKTSQILHLIVLTTSYLLILVGLAQWNMIGNLKDVGHFEAKFLVDALLFVLISMDR